MDITSFKMIPNLELYRLSYSFEIGSDRAYTKKMYFWVFLYLLETLRGKGAFVMKWRIESHSLPQSKFNMCEVVQGCRIPCILPPQICAVDMGEKNATGRTTLNPSAFGATPYSAGKK